MNQVDAEDELALECAKLLEKGDVAGAAQIFSRMMTPDAKAILQERGTPHFGNVAIPDNDW